MLVLLLGLGVWQVERLGWKLGILAQIDRAEAAPAISLPPADTAPEPFLKLRVQGRLDGAHSALFAAQVRDTPTGPQMGGQLIQPLLRDGAPPLLIDRGWVPASDTAIIAAPIDQPSGTVTIEGFVRVAEAPGWLSPKDDPGQRRFYALDPAAIGAALGLSQVAPFTLVAMGQPPAPRYPVPATALPRPPNNHLSYALTWFGLAAVLLAIFVLWSRKVLRP